MEYSQQAKIHGMIELLHRELQKANEQGRPRCVSTTGQGGSDVGVNVGSGPTAAQALGVSGGESVSLFRYVCSQGCVLTSPQSDLSRSFSMVTVESISNRGLLEIGELPDPQQRFLMGLQAAIQAIREDDRINPEDKEKGIDWLEEGKQLGRPLTVEIIKAI